MNRDRMAMSIPWFSALRIHRKEMLKITMAMSTSRSVNPLSIGHLHVVVIHLQGS